MGGCMAWCMGGGGGGDDVDDTVLGVGNLQWYTMFVTFLNENAISLIFQDGILEKLVT